MKNFAQMMKQAQELQGRMAEMQAEMERTSCEGRAGGGMVVVTLSGKGDMVGEVAAAARRHGLDARHRGRIACGAIPLGG